MTLKGLIKQAKEAATALKDSNQKVWVAFRRGVQDAKGKSPSLKKKKVFKGLTFEEQKACANPDDSVRNLVEKDRVLPQRPPKEPAQLDNDGNAVLAVRPPGIAKPNKDPKT